MATAAVTRQGILQMPLVRRFARWIEGVPHPNIAIEFEGRTISGVRWLKTGAVADCVTEALPAGALVPSAVDGNIKQSSIVSEALTKVLNRLNARDEDVALLLPDPVIRVFLQQFDELPRNTREVLPMLRWKLKKSLPFDADETVISFMRQTQQGKGVAAVVAVARQSVVREYENLLEAAGLRCGVILSASLATVALLQGDDAKLLARICDGTLTTAVVRGGRLFVYRCTDLPMSVIEMTPQDLLQEIFPVAAYYQDTAQDTIKSVRLAGLGDRISEFVEPIANELGCQVKSLLPSALAEGVLPQTGRPLADRELEAMAGWMLNED